MDVEARRQGPAGCRGCCRCGEGFGESGGEPVEGQKRDLGGVDLLIFVFFFGGEGESEETREKK